MDENPTSPEHPARGHAQLAAIIVFAGAVLLELAYGCVGDARVAALIENNLGQVHWDRPGGDGNGAYGYADKP